MDKLIPPYGGELPILLTDDYRAQALRKDAIGLPSIDLDWRQLCDLELLLNGSLAPLTGFMGKADLEGVLSGLALADGHFWPHPVVLTVGEAVAGSLAPGQSVALRDAEGFMPAVLHVEEIWPCDPERESGLAVASGLPCRISQSAPGRCYVGGRVEGIALPPRHDFQTARLTPAEVRAQFSRRGWRNVLAMMPAAPLHRMQVEFATEAAKLRQSNLLVLPAAGADPVLDPAHLARIRACMAALPRFPAATTTAAVSALPALPAGPRQTLLRAIVARNYGCNRVIVGGEGLAGEQRRGVDACPVAELSRSKLGVEIVPFPRLVYLEDRDEFVDESAAPDGARRQALGGDEVRRRMMAGQKVPAWYSYPEVLAELAKAFPPRSRQGFTVFFTGLSGAGKSTVARALSVRLMEMGHRRVTLLDGDVVRRHLSSELGFSKAHRDINIRRIGFVASEITKHGGIAVCAPIAPYRQTRSDVRAMIEPWGGFIEVHVSTPIDVCESRDRKGLYAKARAGLIPEFTGVSDPYEIPDSPEVDLDTSRMNVEEAVQYVVLKLEQEGYLG